MKRFFSIVLMAVVAVVLSSCGDDLVVDTVLDEKRNAYFDETIYYRIKSNTPSKREAEVIGCSPTAVEMNIPTKVKILGEEYKVTSIASNACATTQSLKKVVISNSIDSIGDVAFANCKNLASLKIGDNVTFLGYAAFRDCTSLTQVTLPNKLQSTGASTFWGCSNLESVKLGNNIAKIDTMAFYLCIQLAEVNLHDKVKRICNHAFADCALNTLKIPDSVTDIEEGAFLGNQKLTSVKIGKGVKNMEGYVFHNCLSLQTVDVDAANAGYSSMDGVLFNKDKTTLILYPTGRHGDYAVPDGVKEIESSAFYYVLDLTAVSLPNSLEKIGDNAFNRCQKLESVVIPNSVTSIGPSAFDSCIKLQSVSLPANLKRIEQTCFHGCVELPSIDIPASVESIGHNAFGLCTMLTSVVIPDNVKGIECAAFASCVRLSSVVIGSGMKSIGSIAFARCMNLVSVTCLPTTPPDMFRDSFDEFGTLHIKPGCKDAYMYKEYWGLFNIVEDAQ